MNPNANSVQMADIIRQLSDHFQRLQQTVDALDHRLRQVEAQMGIVPPSTIYAQPLGAQTAPTQGHFTPLVPSAMAMAPTQPSTGYASLDRRAEMIELPEDRLPAHGLRHAPSPTAAAPASPRQDAAFDLHQFAQDLVIRYNDTVKQSDLQDLAVQVGAEYYTNERVGDISALLKSEIDRFWLVPLPGQSDLALLLPGFNLRKTWQKLRQMTSDHPLAHHFELLRGDKLVVNRAAVVQRDSNGDWQLLQKGEVSGIS